jgi:hypothetical protein
MLETNISLDFNSMGSNGTHYTLVVRSKNDEAAMTKLEDGLYSYDFAIELFDYENKQIQFNSAPLVTFANGSNTAQISELSSSGALTYYGTLTVPDKDVF